MIERGLEQKKISQMRPSFIFIACALAQLMCATAAGAGNWVFEHVTLIDGIHAPQRT